MHSELLRRLPKAELHCHLDGSVRPQTLLDLGREQGVRMPRDDADALREYMVVKDARHLEDYLARFDVTLSVMQTPDALERIAYELSIDAARDGVRYIEVRYAPVLNRRRGLSLGEAVEAPLRGLERAERDAGTIGRVIVCGLRNLEPAVSLELARLAVAYRARGVVGFDLAGGEAGFPAAEHAAAFAYAREHDLANQLLFAYKINPQTVAYIGYSDGYRALDQDPLEQQQRTYFLKLSYAWLL